MLATKPLALIFVSEGHAEGLFWISMDGEAETCNPQAFIGSFPQTLCVVLDGTFSLSPPRIANIVAQQIGDADVCLVDSYELFAFTKSEDVFREILSGAIERLPNHI